MVDGLSVQAAGVGADWPGITAAARRVDAARRESALFDQAMEVVDGTCALAVSMLLGHGGRDGLAHLAGGFGEAMAEHHWAWVRGAALACTSQLYEREEAEELQQIWRACYGAGSIQGFDLPGRHAVTGCTSVGKSVVTGAFIAHVVEQMQHDKPLGTGQRGLLYCASTVALLGEMRDRLITMGVDESLIGIRYSNSPEYGELAGAPSIHVSEMGEKPVLLVAHRVVNDVSHRIVRRSSRDEERQDDIPELSDLLMFKRRDRVGLWDEAFASYGTKSLNLTDLMLTCQAVEGKLAQEGLSTDEQAAAKSLRETYEALSSARYATGRLLRSVDATPSFISLTDEAVRGARSLQARLGKGLADLSLAIKTVLGMRSLFVHCWAVPAENKTPAVEVGDGLMSHRTAGRAVHLVQPTPKVDARFERLLIFDASYVISAVRADSSVSIANSMQLFDDSSEEGYLIPKSFATVRIHLMRGPSGRTAMEGKREETEKRRGLIKRQVKRMAEFVPPGERFLVATFKQTGKVDWVQEIRSEMTAQGLADWETRAQFITYGQERGLNCWSDCRYGFGIGLLQRDWPSEMRFTRMALSRQMDQPRQLGPGERPMDAVSGEMAAVIQQLVGRLNCRNSYLVPRPDGRGVFPCAMAGECEFWVEMYGPGGNRQVDVERSELVRRLRTVMPGVVITNHALPAHLEGVAPADSGGRKKPGPAKASRDSLQQWVTEQALAWIDARPDHLDAFSTRELNEAMLRRRPELKKSRKTLQRGVDAAKALVSDRAENRWVIVGRQSWVRAT